MKKFPAIVVDYSLSINQMIALSTYGFVCLTIDRLFEKDIWSTESSPKGKGTEEILPNLIYCESRAGMMADEAVKMIERRGFRPGTFRELLAFSGSFLNLNTEAEIVALGSPPGISWLDRRGGGRNLMGCPFWWNSTWYAGYGSEATAFLAFPK